MGTYWGRQAFLEAKKLLGKPYRFGGNYPPLGVSDGTDCSGLCQWAYNEVGIRINRSTETQNEQYPATGPYFNGDLLFFRGALSEQSPGHVGLFAGYGIIGPKQHSWIGSGNPKTGKLIILNAPFTDDPNGIRFDYAEGLGPVLFHTRPGNARKDPVTQRPLSILRRCKP